MLRTTRQPRRNLDFFKIQFCHRTDIIFEFSFFQSFSKKLKMRFYKNQDCFSEKHNYDSNEICAVAGQNCEVKDGKQPKKLIKILNPNFLRNISGGVTN